MKIIYSIIVLAGALFCSSLAFARPPLVAGPAEVAIHGVGQNLSDHEISDTTKVVRGITNVTQVFLYTTTNFTINSGSLLSLIENSFNTNFPAGCQLLLVATSEPVYTFMVSDTTGTNLGFDASAVLTAKFLSNTALVLTGTQTITQTNPPSPELGKIAETLTTVLSLKYDDSAMTNTMDSTHTQFTWTALVRSKSSLNIANGFDDENVTMDITGSGSYRGQDAAIFTGIVHSKISGFRPF
jgi:hypothetical protein